MSNFLEYMQRMEQRRNENIIKLSEVNAKFYQIIGIGVEEFVELYLAGIIKIDKLDKITKMCGMIGVDNTIKFSRDQKFIPFGKIKTMGLIEGEDGELTNE